MATTTLDEDLMAEFAAIAEQAGCELVHVDFSHGSLRVFLDLPDHDPGQGTGGVTLAHCATVSREISALLDVTDFGNDRYTLEVSSPGLDRELYGPRDYERFCGQRARVSFRDRTGARQTVVGQLAEYRPAARQDGRPVGGEITLLEDQGARHEIVVDDIRKARLEIQL